jgi:hypothetical protein
VKRKSPKLPGFSIAEFAAEVGVTASVIRAAVRNGCVKAILFNKQLRIPPREKMLFKETWGDEPEKAAEPPAQIQPNWPSWSC